MPGVLSGAARPRRPPAAGAAWKPASSVGLARLARAVQPRSGRPGGAGCRHGWSGCARRCVSSRPILLPRPGRGQVAPRDVRGCETMSVRIVSKGQEGFPCRHPCPPRSSSSSTARLRAPGHPHAGRVAQQHPDLGGPRRGSPAHLTSEGSLKARNSQRDPRVALSIVDFRGIPTGGAAPRPGGGAPAGSGAQDHGRRSANIGKPFPMRGTRAAWRWWSRWTRRATSSCPSSRRRRGPSRASRSASDFATLSEPRPRSGPRHRGASSACRATRKSSGSG